MEEGSGQRKERVQRQLRGQRAVLVALHTGPQESPTQTDSVISFVVVILSNSFSFYCLVKTGLYQSYPVTGEGPHQPKPSLRLGTGPLIV